MIYLIPIGGLSNRIRAINAAIQLKDKVGKSLTIVWMQDELLNCTFAELFQPLQGAVVMDEPIRNKMLWFHPSVLKPPFRQLTRLLQYIKFDVLLFQKDLNPFWYPDLSDELILKKLKDKKKIFLQTDYNFFGHKKNFLFPGNDIESRLTEMTKVFSDHTIGVHIRRTDHGLAIANSTNEAFARLMDEEIKKDERTTFYLASDDEEVKNDFKGRFSSRLITFEVDNRRNSHTGIKDAYLEILCLSKTSKIIGSYQSSFSMLAATLGGKELVIA